MPKKAASPKNTSSEHDDSSAVSSHIDAMKSPAKEIVSLLRTMILKVNGQITEGIKWNSPSFYWKDWFATADARKGTVMLMLHHGAKAKVGSRVRQVVADESGLLKWHSEDRASVVIATLDDFHDIAPAITKIVQQWATYHSGFCAGTK